MLTRSLLLGSGKKDGGLKALLTHTFGCLPKNVPAFDGIALEWIVLLGISFDWVVLLGLAFNWVVFFGLSFDSVGFTGKLSILNGWMSKTPSQLRIASKVSESQSQYLLNTLAELSSTLGYSTPGCSAPGYSAPGRLTPGCSAPGC